MALIQINDMIEWDFVDDKVPYIKTFMPDRFNKRIRVDYDAYIFGFIGYLNFKKNNNEHSLVIITGKPGSGKSSFVEGMSALDSAFMGVQLSMKDIAWSMENLIKMMDTDENIKRPVWADEFIQGTSRFNQSSIGIRLKIGFVTKRFKKNTYFLVVDELQEIPEKLIKMADAYINVKKVGFKRGYFDMWTSPEKIFSLWKQFKEYSSNWNSPFIKKIKPDKRGLFQDYRGLFLDSKEFDERKLAQTQQGEEFMNSDKISSTALKVYKMKMETPELSFRKIAEEIGIHYTTAADYYRKVKKGLV